MKVIKLLRRIERKGQISIKDYKTQYVEKKKDKLRFDKMTAREDREKEKFTKETVVKYFFDMSKSTYTIMVLGGLAALFGIVETNESGTISAILLGVVLSAVLSIIGYVISKR